MKIRLYKDSVRLRISVSELDNLLNGNEIRESFFWGGSQSGLPLSFALIPSDKTVLHADSAQHSYDLLWESRQLQSWGASDEVGWYETLETAAGGTLSIAIEKDFACKGRTDENKADRFPNPNDPAC